MKIKFIFILFVLLLYGCTPTTSLVNITDEYRPIVPEQSRMFAEYFSNSELDPIIQIKVSKDYLSNKVYIKHYETRRNDIKGTRTAVGIGLTGLGIGLLSMLKDIPDTDTSGRFLTTLGGAGSLLIGLLFIISSTPVDKWTSDSIDNTDTKFAFKEPIKNKLISIRTTQNNINKQVLSDEKGTIKIDIREFYLDLPENSDLKINLTDGIAKPATIEIPSIKIKKIKNNEDLADKLLIEAKKKIELGKFIESREILDKIIQNYPSTLAQKEAEVLTIRIEKDVEYERFNELQDRIKRSSINKLPDLLDRVGITQFDLNDIGQAIENLSSKAILRIYNEGFNLKVSERDALNSFYQLNNLQKLFIVLLGTENIASKNNQQKNRILSDILRTNNDNLIIKLSKINANQLLK